MSRQKNLKRNLLICLLAGSAVMYTLPLHAATSVVANNALPNFDKVMSGALEKNPVISNNGLTMDITQTSHNAVIKWNSFNVGGSATVNFWGPDKHNTLNYVNSANMSQIYGTINANNNGNIFIVNPAGVQIGPSAQINVGSLYVSNSRLSDDALKAVEANNKNFDFNAYMNNNGTHTDAALMSLGNINANNVTFEGNGRIVIDSERIKNDANNATFRVNTNDAGNVVIGYDAYNEVIYNEDGTIKKDKGTYDGKDKNFTGNVFVNGTNPSEAVKGYMWVEDVEQLQAINTNLGGNYALRNSIDATSTAQGTGFNPIGLDDNGKVVVHDGNKYGFTGKFDGIDYNIFGLNINRPGEINVGLFGVAHDANINNVTLVGGSITGGSVVGSVVGAALGNTHITNATNSASVTGNTDVGGIVGYSGDEVDNTENGNIDDIKSESHFTNLVNTGTIHSNGENNVSVSNAGGLIGYMYNGTLDGNSYNLGDVSGDGYNVGGLVGHAVNSIIGDDKNLVYNRLDVEGAYNVGGIVGNMKGTTVQNAENSGNVTATGYTDGTYSYHSAHHNAVKDETVNVANVGGIAGSSSSSSTGTVSNIIDAQNTGDVTSSKVNNQEYYAAGNVGGIVGSAVNTNITNATNKENDVRGAHNVGGVAGYFGGSATITGGINDGGDIMATGARDANGFVTETVRPVGDANESFIIGNIGGVVGYLDGDNVYVTGSANRGTVHTDEPADPAHVEAWQKVANVGGVVGKIDRGTPNTLDGIKKDGIKNGNEKAAVTNSYNTGDVLGYTGVGGVIGMMYNGAVSGSYNLGTVNTTRQVDRSGGSNIDPLNMGGIVGDTTEETNAKAIIYDVYNKGQIGDEEFNYYARHVGGIVGRLSGYVEKAYNTGDIYNNDTVVGGIAGWWYSGTINNAFNTGNITAITATELQVGGLVGAAGANANSLTNAYNLGTIRGYQQANNQAIYLGGIVGKAAKLSIDNVYTLGNLYAGRGSNTYTKVDNGVGYIYGGNYNQNISVKNSYYITSEDTNSFSKGNGNGATQVDFGNRYDKNSYGDFSFSTQTGGIVSDNEVWRIYEGSTTPILNAFLPNTEKYFGNTTQNPDAMNNITSIQYGTAYDPLLTIINAKDNLIFDWDKLGIGGAGSLVVYGGSLTLDNVSTSNATGGSSYYGGVLYSDGALTIDARDNENLGFGSASELYGSEVTIKADGTVTIYGDVTATGNANDNDTTGNVTINAGDVNVYGTLTSATAGKDVSISGIANKGNGELTFNDVNNPYSAMPHVGDRFNINITAKDNIDGDITITAGQNNTGNGNVNLYFGNKEEGLITTGGNLTVTGTGDVYVDSDLDIAGNMTLTSTGKDGEVLLTLTNIGKVQADRFTEVIEKAINGIEVTEANKNKLIDVINSAVGKEFPDLGFSDDPQKAEAIVTTLINGNNKVEAIDTLNNDVAIEYMHDFMHSFERSNNQDTPDITLSSASGNSKLTVDMWEDNDNGTGQFNFEKYDSNSIYTSDEHTFVEELNNLNLTINDNSNIDAADVVYVEVHNGEQLKGIQSAGNDALGYNYALMGDINASDVTDYEAIGTNSANGFTGTFDGRGNRIIGLKVSGDNAGIFSEIGTRTENINGEIVTHTGTVKNVNIYSGNFEGTNTAGAVAGVNEGRIENVTGFGNTVTVTGDVNNAGNAGGIVGVNNGKSDFETSDDGASTLTGNGIYDVQSIGSVIAGDTSVVAGGLVGTNDGALGNSYSDSAVTSTAGTSAGLGGVAGVNTGDVQFVDSLGVTNGGTSSSSNVGGIIGVNNGNMYSGYNESIVSGSSNVGGIIGNNSSTVANVVNATSVTGNDKDTTDVSEYVGGLVGNNNGDVNNGRNNGTITGTKYVGGMVGNNAEGSTLTNLVNDSSAAISGVQYVGGIAGKNEGIITANSSNLINRGSITGNQYVGGVAGMNTGEIRNTVNSVVLNATGNDAKYFGGVAGYNDGTIGTVTNTSTIDVTAQDGTLVGGIIGYNAENGTLEGEIVNEGNISGESEVGGIIGENINQSILNNENKPRLTISNKGNVSATDGGAAGIFYDNKSVIDNVDLVNEGTVTGGKDDDSITGGLFGINTGNITNSTLTNTGKVTGGGTVGGLIGNNSGIASGSVFTNDGIVEGEDKVGGLFGINSGSFNTSSLINTVNAQVTGKREVGGLIGVNSGNIEGGRLEADGKTDAGYYKYQIYNNGTITVTGEGQNIGGLIGYNTIANRTPGSLTAGYNTGAIKAENSSNVGGIVGNNAGTVDQVFNTVMTGVDDKGNTVYGTITGKDNVGGLVGTNSGTLSNAYNTTDVSGTTNVGNAVGRNEANATVNNVYDVNNTGNRLIAENNGNVTGSYSGNEADKKTTGITYVAEGDKLKEDSYKDSLNDADTWKFYDGNSNPLLKVFLTDVEIKVDVDEINEYINNVYNGNAQAITDEDIDKLIAAGAITAPDNFAAYNNAKELINSISHTNAGEYSDWLYSQQIASNGNGEIFNPNNLGYNIALTADIDTAKLTINLGEVTHIYGAPNTNGYNYTVEGWINPDDANDYTITIGTLGNGITDNALKDNNIHTNDVDEYTWSTTTASISANGSLNNYEIVTVKDGTSKVIPVTINVILNDVTHIYGDSFNSNDYTVGNVDWVNGDNYTTADVVLSNINDGAFTNGNGGKTNDVTADGYKWNATVSGNGANAESINKNYIFNVIDGDSKVTPKEVTIEDILASIEYGSKGDFTVENTGNINGTVYDDNLGISYTDTSVIAGSEYALNQNGRDTADVKVNNGVYTDSISINGIKLTGDKAGNYYISSDTAKGDIRVDKAQIHIGANNEAIHVGEKPDYIGTDINGALVNGDKLNGNYHYGVENSADEKVVGDHSIGVWIGNTFYDLSATVDWTKVDGFFANYNVTFVPGTLTVTEQVMPDLPDNWPNNRWDYLFGDNPFDRNENFRERKAEVNFVDGAMEI